MDKEGSTEQEMYTSKSFGWGSGHYTDVWKKVDRQNVDSSARSTVLNGFAEGRLHNVIFRNVDVPKFTVRVRG